MNRGYFKFCFGAMGCGKTQKLQGDYYSKVEDGFEVIVVKPFSDKKGGKNTITRSNSILETKFTFKKEDNIYLLISEYLLENNLDFILVEEIQFLTSQQIVQLANIVDKLGITVIGYGILTDFLGNMFPGAITAMEQADEFEYLKRQCSCGNLKIRNMRLKNGNPVFEGEQVAIDGVDAEYKPVCRSCYEKEKNKAKKRLLIKTKNTEQSS